MKSNFTQMSWQIKGLLNKLLVFWQHLFGNNRKKVMIKGRSRCHAFISRLVLLLGVFIFSITSVDARPFKRDYIKFIQKGEMLHIQLPGTFYNDDGSEDELDDLKIYYYNEDNESWIQVFVGDMDNDDRWQTWGSGEAELGDTWLQSNNQEKWGSLSFSLTGKVDNSSIFTTRIKIKAVVQWDEGAHIENTGSIVTYEYTVPTDAPLSPTGCVELKNFLGGIKATKDFYGSLSTLFSNNNEFTIETSFLPNWKYGSHENNNHVLFKYKNGSKDIAIGFIKDSDQTYTVGVYSTDGTNVVTKLTNWDTEMYNKPIHLAVTYQNQNATLYVNGEQKGSGSYTVPAIDVDHFYIGDYPGDGNYGANVCLSTFRVWDKCLSQNEVQYVDDLFIPFDTHDFAAPYNELNANVRFNLFASVGYGNAEGVADEMVDLEDNFDLEPKGEEDIELIGAFSVLIPPKPISIESYEECDKILLVITNPVIKEGSNNYYTYSIVERQEAGTENWDEIAKLNFTNKILLSDNEALPGKRYKYRVRNVWRKGWLLDFILLDSEFLESGSDYISCKKPGPVQNCSVDFDENTGRTTGDVGLTWDPLYPAPSRYKIMYSTDNGNIWQEVDNTNITSNNYSVDFSSLSKQVHLGTPVQFKISGINDEGCENWSAVIEGTPNMPCDNAPANVVATENVDKTITLSWDYTRTSGGPATEFEIYRSDIKIGVSTETAFTDDGPPQCDDISYKIKAVNSCSGTANALSLSSNSINVESDFTGVTALQNLTATKGYHGDKVLLTWETVEKYKASIDKIEIYRERAHGTFRELINTVTNVNQTSYEDYTCDANELYTYKVRAINNCNDSDAASAEISTTGFRRNTGIINGTVTFEGGNAVEGVEVAVRPKDGLEGKSWRFDAFNEWEGETSKTVAEMGLLNKNAFTIEMWVNVSQVGQRSQTIFHTSDNKLQLLYGTNGKFSVMANNYYLFSSSPTQEINKWIHVALTCDLITYPKAKLFINGKKVGGESNGISSLSSSASIKIGGKSSWGSYLTGYIDEMHIWNYARSEQDIGNRYTNMLSGNEDGLVACYHFDEGFGNTAYDISKENGEYHKNDMIFNQSRADWSNETPNFDQLHPAAITNEYGNYTVEVPYGNNGEIFSVIPKLGVHEFNPGNSTVFIGDHNQVQNKTDFEDKSSFTFDGIAVYAGKECDYQEAKNKYPVEGAIVYIDNLPVFDDGQEQVVTKSDGSFSVKVPIGNHYVSVKKDNHTFMFKGQWPHPSTSNPYKKEYFSEDVEKIVFVDTTTVRLIGKYVGGHIEASKKYHFGGSKANIGTGKITINPKKEVYNIFKDVNGNAVSDTVILTDEHGEYYIDLIPEKFDIKVENNNIDLPVYYNFIENVPLLDVTEIPDNEKVVRHEQHGNILEFPYHFERNFIVYADPEISVAGDVLTGDKSIEIEYADGNNLVKETIDLNPETGVKPFDFPVYKMGKDYSIDVKVVEVYDDGNEKDTMAVEGAVVEITNNLAANSETRSDTTNVDGILKDYTRFKAGLPEINLVINDSTSFTKTLDITAKSKNGKRISWRETNNPFRGYVLGHKEIGGSDFITYGPEVPVLILRDPPGSNSYAYIKKGSSFSSTQSYHKMQESEKGFNFEYKKGQKLVFNNPLGGPSLITNFVMDNNIGFGTSSYINRQGEFTKTYNFNQEFQTSSDPSAVGSMADIFISESKNAYFTSTQSLKIRQKQYCKDMLIADGNIQCDINLGRGQYTFCILEDQALSPETKKTNFIYTQHHILSNLIPEYRQGIVDALQNDTCFVSRISPEHKFYGLPNDHEVWDDSIYIWEKRIETLDENDDSEEIVNLEHIMLHPSYDTISLKQQNRIDTIAHLFQQMSIWMQTLALNEAQKLNKDYSLIENISFDGLVGEYKNEVEYTEEKAKNNEYSINYKLQSGAKNGLTLNKKGIILSSKTSYTNTTTVGEGSEETSSFTWGYVISDGDKGDYLNIEVKHNGDGTHDWYAKDGFTSLNNIDDVEGMLQTQMMGGGGSQVTSALLSQFVKKKKVGAISQGIDFAAAAIFTGATMSKMNNYDVRDDDVMDVDKVNFGMPMVSPVYKLLGGKSRCPYEGPEMAAFNLDTIADDLLGHRQLNVGTQPHEVPYIDVYPRRQSNVPDDQEAAFTIELKNDANSDLTAFFELAVVEESNPYGAVILVDGLSPNRGFTIPGNNVAVTKTLTVRKGAKDSLNYENLQMVLRSECEILRYDTIAFSVNFLPSCANVEFANMDDEIIINKSHNDTTQFIISGYNVNQSNFGKIHLNYHEQGNDPQHLITYCNDNTGVMPCQETDTLINNEPELKFNFIPDYYNIFDGNGKLVLSSECSDGSETAKEYSLILDRKSPMTFGTPAPADGILNSGENIRIKFDEPINQGHLLNYQSRLVSVTGVKNGLDLTNQDRLMHNVSLQFANNSSLIVRDGVNFSNSAFTFKFWIKRETNGRECIISQGDDVNGGLWIGFDADDHFVFKVGNESLVTEEIYSENLENWSHITCGYSIDDQKLFSEIAYGSSTDKTFKEGVILGYIDKGDFEVGNGFSGSMHHLAIWKKENRLNDLYTIYNGFEKGLTGYYPMNEGIGVITEDKASSRHGLLDKTTWSFYDDNKSLYTNNASIYLHQNGLVFDDETDFTIEFWVKGVAQDATLFSNGRGYIADKEIGIWNVHSRQDGTIWIKNDNNIVLDNISGFLDDTWRHFALSVNRLGNTVKCYHDGDLVRQSSANGLSGYVLAKTTLGARNIPNGTMPEFDRNFSGYFDELKIWNSARPAELIKQNVNVAPTGNEAGLKVYFDFNQVSDDTCSNLAVDARDYVKVCHLKGAVQKDVSTGIKVANPVSEIDFSLNVNNDEVVVNLTESLNIIENQQLTVSIEGVKDLNGNKMESVKTWTAYINQNSLIWDADQLLVNVDEGSQKQFAVNIINKGGVVEYYNIDNLPVWLSSTETEGTLEPMTEKQIIFTVDEVLNTGDYSAEIYLSGNSEFNERLNIRAKVRTQSPEWHVLSSEYENSMNMIGDLRINGNFSTDESDVVGAFINDTCHGVANLTYYPDHDIYRVFMEVYGDEIHQYQSIDFRVWDASKGLLYTDVTPADLNFVKDAIEGTVSMPISIETNGNVTNTIAVNNGWNWLSFNLESDQLDSAYQLMAGVNSATNDQIKSMNEHVKYVHPYNWSGGNNPGMPFEQSKMYKLKNSYADTIQLSGVPVSTSSYPVDIVSDWNWIGYTPQYKMPVSSALAYHTPSQDDLLKSQTKFAMYDNTLGWIGSLKYMKPNAGYMYHSNNSDAASFVYPQETLFKKTASVDDEDQSPINALYEHNMSAMIEVMNNPVGNIFQSKLVALVDGKIVGQTLPISAGNHMIYPLSISGQSTEKDLIFHLVENGSEMVHTADQQAVYRPNKILGTVKDPYMLTFSTSGRSKVVVSPNPFKGKTTISNISEEVSKVVLYDMQGRIIRQWKNLELGEITWDGTSQSGANVPTGVYMLKLLGADVYQPEMIIKLRD